MAFIIKDFTAFIATDENGEEGLIAMMTRTGMMPLIAADRTRAEALLPIAQDIAKAQGRTVQVIRFQAREELGYISPEGEYNGIPIL